MANLWKVIHEIRHPMGLRHPVHQNGEGVAVTNIFILAHTYEYTHPHPHTYTNTHASVASRSLTHTYIASRSLSHTHMLEHEVRYVCVCVCACVRVCVCHKNGEVIAVINYLHLTLNCGRSHMHDSGCIICRYGVATISRLPKNICL